jgi:hypothetical protein
MFEKLVESLKESFMAHDCLSVQLKDAANGGDEAMTKYGASPATAERGLTTNAAKYGGKETEAGETNYSDNKSVKTQDNGLAGS